MFDLSALPTLPCLDMYCQEWAWEERMQRYMDRADRALMSGKVAQRDYDEWVRRLNKIDQEQVRTYYRYTNLYRAQR